ncbi:MAG: LysR family transcriptional regulator [Chloroflexi bacterium]|nr:LysR family transcriptional regulator [Chloroflexota bacterium]
MKSTGKIIKRATRSPTTQTRHAAFSPRCKVWLELDGKVALSAWRVELLELIEETGSLTLAAKHLQVPYRTAWYKLKDIEECLGLKLVVTESGGLKGGGSHLTPEAQQIIARFRRVTAGVSQMVEERFRKQFEDVRFTQSPNHQEDKR